MARLGSITSATDISAGGGGGGATQALMETRTLAVAATIDASVKSLRTAGYAAIGDGGDGPYNRLATHPHPLWASGINYSVNDKIRNASGVLYRCTLDPGINTTPDPDVPYLSANQPVHATVGTEVIGADLYGWTCVALNPAYFRSIDRFTLSGATDATNGGYWGLVTDNGRMRIEQFGGKADFDLVTRSITGVTDNLAPFNHAVAFVGVLGANPYLSGGLIEYGYGGYWHSDTLRPTHTVTIQGLRDTVLNGGRAANIVVPDGVPGVVIRPGVVNGPVTSAAGTTIRDIAISPRLGGSLVTSAHGVEIKHPAALFDVTINAFGGNGVHIVADVGSGSNSNVWYMERVYTIKNEGNGVYLQAGDSNAGTGIAINAMENKGWGILDSSFLGNSFIGCHTAGNILGCYKASDPNARSIFLGCYQEGDQPNAQVDGLNMMLGGIVSNDGGGPTWTNGVMGRLLFKHRADDTNANIGLGMRLSADEFMAVFCDALYEPYRVRYDPAYGVITAFSHVTGGAGPINITTLNNTIAAGRSAPLPHAQITFPNGIWVGPTRHEVRNITNGLAAPTTGAWARGDIVYNQEPSAGGFAGWICITTGTPGVWKTFGAITA